ncbi:hypothetical protein PSCICL_12950 [Pseudomonas cichorii]|nr:hypothetical protein [Pseudomonas cichorii]GFM70303.1 hypothetical protein PSCICL_12950 [Pseudomonas cichorii]
MGMYISISNGSGWGGAGGVFDCIVESTRELFGKDQYGCMRKIYEALDEQAQSFIVLDDVASECFNLFYSHCKTAMDSFPESSRGKKVPENHIPGILWNWSEVLRLMREDIRYKE